jgi:hypothetical protein
MVMSPYLVCLYKCLLICDSFPNESYYSGYFADLLKGFFMRDYSSNLLLMYSFTLPSEFISFCDLGMLKFIRGTKERKRKKERKKEEQVFMTYIAV